jgi:hypothetical protein
VVEVLFIVMSLRKIGWYAWFGAFTAVAWGAAGPPPGPTAFDPTPGVAQYAKAHGLPLDHFELAAAKDTAHVGDTLTVLFTIEEGATARQWLAEFRLVALTEKEAKAKPGSGLGLIGLFFNSLKTDTGHEYGFAPGPLALAIRTFGPFARGSATPSAPPTAARVLAGRDYLAHGLAQMCEIETRLHDTGKADPRISYMFLPRYSDAQVAATKARAAAAAFTPDDERVFAEGYLALVQFAYLAMKTDGVGDLMRELVDPPSLFSGAFINPDWSGLKLEDSREWGLPGVRIFRMPYNFLSKTNARGALFVTVPQPPLQNIAGIVGLTVDWSSKTPDKRLVMRVLASRRGPGEETAVAK